MLELIFNQEILGIIGRTLRMTLTSTFIAFCIGVPLGLLLEKLKFPGKKIVIAANRTFMATPPVVAGLVVYMMLKREGPFGQYSMLFSLEAMIIAQVVLITPIICGIVHTSAAKNGTQIRAFAYTMGANKLQTQVLMIRELSNEIFFSAVTGFGRAMSEVGAIMMVGGNIRFHTRVMTTAIALDARRGFF
jgi:tungstate transport system permease protein